MVAARLRVDVVFMNRVLLVVISNRAISCSCVEDWGCDIQLKFLGRVLVHWVGTSDRIMVNKWSIVSKILRRL